MKRTLVALLLASMTLPAFAVEVGAPFEQTQFDRALPSVKDPVVDTASSGSTFFGIKESAPYEQYKIDTALPNVKDPVVSQPVQVAGPATAYSSSEATGPWAQDWNFIAPPQ